MSYKPVKKAHPCCPTGQASCGLAVIKGTPLVEHQEGFEPTTNGLEGRHSSQTELLMRGTVGQTRTDNLLLTRQLLYQLSHERHGPYGWSRTSGLLNPNQVLCAN